MYIIEKPSFRRLLLYQHGPAAKETDIPHCTKLAGLIDETATNIKEQLIDEYATLPNG